MHQLSTPYDIKIKTAFPLINAVLGNLQDGKVFQADHSDGVCLIMHKAGFSYLTPNKENDYSETLDFLLTTREIPVYFHLYDPQKPLIDLCRSKNESVNIKIRKRIQLKFNGQKLKPETTNLPTHYTIQQINAGNFEKIAIFNLSLENKFWTSKEAFIKNGFGFCLFNEIDLPVSVCYTACVAENTAEIDVATLPGYQRKGFANTTVKAFVEHCSQNNIIANWDCFEENYGSLKTAQTIGFSYEMTYNFLSIFNKKTL